MTTVKRELLNTALIIAGIASAGFGLKGFLLSSHFIDGGVTGVSMLLGQVIGIPLSIVLPIINVPFVIVGYAHMGRAFAVRSALGIAGLAATLAVVPYPDVTPDLLLTAAHCVLAGADYKLVELGSDRTKPILKDIARVARHPQFNLKTMLAHRATADVALLKLAAPLPVPAVVAAAAAARCGG